MAKSYFGAVWTDWSGNYLDLNSIENILSMIQESVFKHPKPKNRDQLIFRFKQMRISACGSYNSRISK